MISPLRSTRKKRRSGRNAGGVPISAFSTTLEGKPKRGRRTIPDNFLLGTRNGWAALLEESWPEIGSSLLSIAKRRNSTAEDVHNAFEPVKQKPHNSGLATPLYRESSQVATPADVRNNRIRLGNLQSEIVKAQAKCEDLRRGCLEVDMALKSPNPEHEETFRTIAAHRLQDLQRSEDDLRKLQMEQEALNRKVSDEEAFVFRSELLDFLHSGRYAVTPQNLADATAGLPWMRWRQSFVRCSRMPSNQPMPTYLAFEALAELWDGRPQEIERGPVEFFRSEILNLPKKKFRYARQFLGENWRDLRLAVEECCSPKHQDASIPFLLTSALMRNVRRQKDAAERILAEHERFEA